MVETAIILATVAAAASTAMAGVSAAEQASAQSKAAQYQANRAHEAGLQASNTAAANEATSIRESGGALGEQAAAFGQANIGTTGSVADVERQSAGNARLDALNIWYGGELERRGYEEQAKMERYNALTYKRNADMALIQGGIGAGTQLLSGATNYGYYKKTGMLPGYGGGKP